MNADATSSTKVLVSAPALGGVVSAVSSSSRLTPFQPGRGVFASQPIAKGTVIDISPVIIIPESEVTKHVEHTCLNHYT